MEKREPPCSGDIFAAGSVPLGAECAGVLAEGGNVKIERIISNGASSPPGFWYDQEQDEWVGVLQGQGILDFGKELRTLNTGEWILIPAHSRHRVYSSSSNPPCIWLCVFFDKK